MSGECVGMPGGGSVGWPGLDGSGGGSAGLVGGSWGSGCCMMALQCFRTPLRTVGCPCFALPKPPRLL